MKLILSLTGLLLVLVFSGCRTPPLQAKHEKGITTLTWQPISSQERFYYVYRYTERIGNSNWYFSERIAAGLPSATRELSVKVKDSGKHYYAVSTGGPDGQLNTILYRTGEPIEEKTAP
jgi:hypothetical protein